MVLSEEQRTYRQRKREKRERPLTKWDVAKNIVKSHEERAKRLGRELVDVLLDIPVEDADARALAIGHVKASHKNLSPRRRKIMRIAALQLAEFRHEELRLAKQLRAERPSHLRFGRLT